MMRPLHQTAAPDIPSHGVCPGSGAGGVTSISKVPSRQLDSGEIVPLAWWLSRYRVLPVSARSLKRGKPTAMQSRDIARWPSVPNRAGMKRSPGPGGAISRTAMSAAGLVIATVASAVHWLGRSASNLTRMVLAPETCLLYTSDAADDLLCVDL